MIRYLALCFSVVLLLVSFVLLLASIVFAGQVKMTASVEGWYEVVEDKENYKLEIFTNYPEVWLNGQRVR